jgi:hypothetical protein
MDVLGAVKSALIDPGRSAPSTCVRGGLRITAFFGLIIALAFALDAFIGMSLRRLTTGDFGEWNRIIDGQVNADIVISGSSRALTHYDPRVLSAATGRSAYNIGLNGSQTDMQLARLKTYLRHNRKPQLLIHNLDAFSFQTSHGEVYDPGQYVPYLHEVDLYEALSKVNPNTRKARYVPLYGYAAQDLRFGWLLGIRGWLGSVKHTETHVLGFAAHDRAWTGEFDRFRRANPEGVTVAIDSEGVWLVEELIHLCAARNIRLALVYSPEYIEAQNMTRNRAEIFAHFMDLSRRFGVSFFDYSDSPLSQNKKFFYNSQHLNAAGADLFSKDLADRLRSEVELAVAALGER